MTQQLDTVIREDLQQNMKVAEVIRSAAGELEVVRAVLAATGAVQAALPDVQAAVDRMKLIEQKLDEVTRTLERLCEIATPPQ